MPVSGVLMWSTIFKYLISWFAMLYRVIVLCIEILQVFFVSKNILKLDLIRLLFIMLHAKNTNTNN